jgi:hypothetical protein
MLIFLCLAEDYECDMHDILIIDSIMLFDGKTKVAMVNDSYATETFSMSFRSGTTCRVRCKLYTTNCFLFLCIDENGQCLQCLLLQVIDVYINCIRVKQTSTAGMDMTYIWKLP